MVNALHSRLSAIIFLTQRTRNMSESHAVLNFYGVKDEYGVFSNFYGAPFVLKGVQWPTVEVFCHNCLSLLIAAGAASESAYLHLAALFPGTEVSWHRARGVDSVTCNMACLFSVSLLWRLQNNMLTHARTFHQQLLAHV